MVMIGGDSVLVTGIVVVVVAVVVVAVVVFAVVVVLAAVDLVAGEVVGCLLVKNEVAAFVVKNKVVGAREVDTHVSSLTSSHKSAKQIMGKSEIASKSCLVIVTALKTVIFFI